MRRNFFVVLLLVVLLSGFTFVTRRDTKITPSPTPSPVRADKEATDAKLATLQFYQAYDTCIKQPPKEITTDISSYCQEKNTFMTSRGQGNVEQRTDTTTAVDPVLCSHDIPTGYQVTDAKSNNQSMKVTLHALFGSSNQEIIVQVVKEDNGWKVANITCSTS